MMNSFENYDLKSMLMCILGISLTCLTASIFYLISLGSDPYQVFAIAIHKKIGISYGQANILLNFLILLFFGIFKRSYIKIAMFFSLIFTGPCIDVFNIILKNFIVPELPMSIKLVLGFLGCITLGLGSYIYISANLGASPADSIGLFISELTRIPYKIIRIFTDALYMSIGLLLGGAIGITTVMAVILTGPFIGMFQKIFEQKNQ